MKIETKSLHFCSTFVRHTNSKHKTQPSERAASTAVFNGSSIKFSILVFVTCVSSFTFGQSISGKITDQNSNPLEFVSVTLEKANSIVATSMTNIKGSYILKNLEINSTYRVSFSLIGYLKTDTTFVVNGNLNANIILRIDTAQLKIVTVTGNRPLFEKKKDRFIFKVGNSNIAKGNSAWELLKETPLINTSEQGNITISGTDGARICINGRKLFFTGDALTNYLKSINVENVEKIEIVTVPSSKYEAEGGAGFINIVLKKNVADGLNGTVSLTSKQNKYNSQNSNLDLNFRHKNLNIYGNFWVSNQKLFFIGKNNIEYKTNGIINYVNNNSIERKLYNNPEFSPTLGIDIKISKKSTLGFLIDYTNKKLTRQNTTQSKFIDPIVNTLDSLNNTYSTNHEYTKYISSNINYDLITDSLGSLLSVDVDYFYYNEKRETNQSTFLVDDQSNNIFKRDDFLSTLPQKINNSAFAIDYSKKLNAKQTIEFGTKYKNSHTKSDVSFLTVQNGSYKIDTSRSNLFKYSEKIFAIYANFSNEINAKWNYQMGIRFEHTNAYGQQINYNEVDKNNYFRLFPTLFLNYSLNKKHQFSYAYSSRINRPSFWDINPFKYYISENIYNTGNPFLLPSRLYKQEITYNLKSIYIFQIVYEKTKDIFSTLNIQDSQYFIHKNVNYGSKNKISLNVTFGKKVFSFWHLRFNADIGYNYFKGSYQNIIIDKKTITQNFNIINNFTISSKRSIYLTVPISNSIQHYSQNIFVKNQFIANIWLRKILFKGNGTFNLGISDIFKSAKDQYNTKLSNANFNEIYYYGNRVISGSFNYKFGKKTIRRQRNRTTSNNEEKSRLNR